MADNYQQMFERTGCETGTAIIEAIFYILLRDGDLSPGRLEALLQELEEACVGENATTNHFRYSNGFLSRYVKDIIARIHNIEMNLDEKQTHSFNKTTQEI